MFSAIVMLCWFALHSNWLIVTRESKRSHPRAMNLIAVVKADWPSKGAKHPDLMIREHERFNYMDALGTYYRCQVGPVAGRVTSRRFEDSFVMFMRQ